MEGDSSLPLLQYEETQIDPFFTCILCFFFQARAKVAVLGAAGGIGQPMALLLKESPLISQLVLYDVVNTAGVAADISHIETPAQVIRGCGWGYVWWVWSVLYFEVYRGDFVGWNSKNKY